LDTFFQEQRAADAGTVMGEAAGGGYDSLGGDALAGDVDETHGVAYHPGIGEVEQFGDRSIGGDATAGDLADHVKDHIDRGGFPFPRRAYRDKAFFL
jgi:hypothetical protein